MKIGDKYLVCPIGFDINFSDKPNWRNNRRSSLYLRGDSPSITKSENSKDIFGDIILSASSISSSYSKLNIDLFSVEGANTIISLNFRICRKCTRIKCK